MIESFHGRLLILSIAAAFTVSPFASAQPVPEGRTAQDRRFVTGGVGLEESEQMKAMAPDFPLAIIVAAKSGAYVADTHVKIQDAQGKMVLEMQLDSPYLLVDLARGKYNLEATHQGQKQQRSVNIDASTRAKVVFSFDVPDDRAGIASNN